MAALRAQLNRLAATWLVFQVITLAVLVSGSGCPGPEAQTRTMDCASMAAEECPMAAITGQPCPMHPGAATSGRSHASAGETRHATPVLECPCNTPMRMLASLLPEAGVLTPVVQATTGTTVTLLPPVRSLTLDQPPQHDTPPPRS